MSKVDRDSAAYKEAAASCLRWDHERDEPYLQLPSFPDLRLIPYRQGLADNIEKLFNHPVVGERLFALPYPMSHEFAVEFEQRNLKTYKPILEQIAQTIDSKTCKPKSTAPFSIPGFPFKCVWNVTEQRMVGDVNIDVNTEDPITHIKGEEMRTRPIQEQSWMAGYVLEPSLHGQGVMSEVISCMIEGWVKPFMHVGEIVAWVASDNEGSKRVIKKHGFQLVHEEWSQWPEHKGGGKKHAGYHVLKLNAS